ncbi:MAG: hypothetical protein V7K40_06945 [Nostoc sp.]|uniref:hypothetical protein n=1 Tax=Nostoc sp. TaxID=1180 RepID=UPI002FFC5D88
MVLKQILKIVLVTSSIWFWVAISVTATEVNKQAQGKSVGAALLNSKTTREIPRLGEVGFPSTLAQQLVQSPAPQTAPTQKLCK